MRDQLRQKLLRAKVRFEQGSVTAQDVLPDRRLCVRYQYQAVLDQTADIPDALDRAARLPLFEVCAIQRRARHQ